MCEAALTGELDGRLCIASHGISMYVVSPYRGVGWETLYWLPRHIYVCSEPSQGSWMGDFVMPPMAYLCM